MNNPAQTLVILSPAFPKNESELNWVPLQQSLVKELKQQFPELNIIVLSFFYPYETMEYSWHDVRVIAYNGRGKRKLKRLKLWGDVWKKLNKIRKSNNTIGIFSFWCGECALIGNYFGRLYGIKHYCWICGKDAKKENKFPRFIRARANELIALSDFLQNEFGENHGTRPGIVIPPGIDVKQFNDFPQERDIDILGAGTLSALKQYHIFLQVVAEVKKEIPAVKAVLIGDGPEKDNLQNLIVRLGIDENLILTGALPHTEVLQMMQRTRVFLHPSSYEGFGVVCLEALYGGAHVFSFVQPMNREIKNWSIVKTKEEMVEKTKALLEDPHIKYEQKLVYSISDVAEKVMGLFDLTT